MAHEKIDAALETFYAGDVDGAEGALKEIGGGKLEPPAGLEPLDEAAYYEGIGGIRLLRALGFNVHTYHLNEVHAALLADLATDRKSLADVL